MTVEARVDDIAAGVYRLSLACMHGASFAGDCAALLRSLADAYERRFAAAGGA